MENNKIGMPLGLPEKSSEDNRTSGLIRGLFGTSFVEVGAYRGSRDADGKAVICNTVTGYGAVDDVLVYAFAQDGNNCDGALSELSANKIVSLIKRAGREGAPIVGFFDSCGAIIEEGIAALAGYGRIMRALATKRGHGPLIAVITGPCTGGLAVISEMFDIVIALRDSKFYLNPTYIARDELKSTGRAVPELGTVSAAAMRGEITLLCDDESGAIEAVKNLIGYIAYPEGESTDSYQRRTDEVAGIISEPMYDAHEVVRAICDDGRYFESKPGYANELITVFSRICGDTVAIVASNPSHHDGLLSERASRKARSFISLSNTFGIPVITLVDTAGFDTTAPTELECTALHMAELAYLYASTSNTHVTVVTGRAYGTASIILGSRSLGADICLALNSADMSILDPDTVVQFKYGEEIDSSENPVRERSERVKEWKRIHAGTAEAALYGEIDDVIDPGELRLRIAAAIKECK